MLINVLEGKKLPVYGDGSNVRDWLFVEDHCSAINAVHESGCIGETYNIGGENEVVNLDLVKEMCRQIDQKISSYKELIRRYPNSAPAKGYDSELLIQFVADRPGHDYRYAIDPSKIAVELGFRPRMNFKKGLSITLDWYLNNEAWWRNVIIGKYQDWINQHYGKYLA